jgi:3'-phosphoadenosine 5'-phosphosulfate (PAPS) 3'-phosphatase
MSHPDIATLMTVAWEAANSAGEIVRENWQEPKTIEYKGAIDLVTSVDRESERKIVNLIRRHFPAHSIWQKKKPTFKARKTTIAGLSTRSMARQTLPTATHSFASPSPLNTAAELSWDWFTIRSGANASKR